MDAKTCTCGRPAGFVRWDYTGRSKSERVPCCAFHKVYPDKTHPFDTPAAPQESS